MNCPNFHHIQIDTTLFNYAGHTQPKLVSRWGVGEHVTMIKTSIYKIITWNQCDPVEGMGGEGQVYV